jgi:hypothetical protein
MAVSPDSAFTCQASWFCCGASWGPCGSHGGGACGNCNSGSLQCAWPNTSASCLSITQPGACGDSLARQGCGHTFYVASLCSGKQISVGISDCGPNAHEFCGQQSCCSGKCGTDRLLDLTAAAFSSLASLSSGVTAVSIHS